MNPYALGIITSIVIYLLIGSYAGRRVKDVDDYFVAGRDSSTLLIAGLVASYLTDTSADVVQLHG